MPQRKKYRRNCKQCNKKCHLFAAVFCSNACQQLHRQLDCDQIVEETGNLADAYKTARAVRSYMLRHFKHTCVLCNRRNWQHSRIPLVVDHIDGNSLNSRLDNLRLVCCNCDALLPTYKNKNRGNGRHLRMQRYKQGKSF